MEDAIENKGATMIRPEFLDNILNDNLHQASEDLEDILADKIWNSIELKKKETASTIFNSDDSEELSENIDLLRDIADTNKSQRYEFGDGSDLEVDVQTASLLLIVYESLSGSNQKKFEDNIYKSKKEFLKLVDFAKDKVG